MAGHAAIALSQNSAVMDASHKCLRGHTEVAQIHELLQACTSLEVDIITFDLAKRLPFRLKPGPLQSALQRGLFLEVKQKSVHGVQLCTLLPCMTVSLQHVSVLQDTCKITA